MTRRGSSGTPLAARIVPIGAAIVAMVAVVVALARTQAARGSAPSRAADAILATPAPIAAEAEVFRARRDAPPASADADRRRAAHPRTLATYRTIRAYPGAPPRIPHGLTADELRTARCGACHDRGGYSQRFGAYAPATPHAELESCLQCHAPDAAVAGVPLPGRDADDVCRQCHAPPAARVPGLAIDWPTPAWPRPTRAAPAGGPSPIPHDLQLRENCLACHAGPAAVAELRTTHPERADCRQCHLLVDPEAGEFSRRVPVARVAGGVR